MFFRIYPLDEKGRYRVPVEVECDADADVLAVAAGMGERLKGDFDVWQLGRFVGRFHIDAEGRARPVTHQPGDAAPQA